MTVRFEEVKGNTEIEGAKLHLARPNGSSGWAVWTGLVHQDPGCAPGGSQSRVPAGCRMEAMNTWRRTRDGERKFLRRGFRGERIIEWDTGVWIRVRRAYPVCALQPSLVSGP